MKHRTAFRSHRAAVARHRTVSIRLSLAGLARARWPPGCMAGHKVPRRLAISQAVEDEETEDRGHRPLSRGGIAAGGRSYRRGSGALPVESRGVKRRRIRYGMVGGGGGAVIGAAHRSAARLDGDLELVCGAFSSDAERSRRAGASLHLDPERCYADYREMFASERKIASGARSYNDNEGMDFVVIVTPNHLHFPVAVAALKSGFHVLSDKPATVSLAECRELRDEIKKSGLLYGLTHPYTSYPLIVEARQRVAAGQLGTIRKVIVEYTQGWLPGDGQ